MAKTLKILVATDYSEAVMNAEHFAVQLARADKDIFLRFLHVFEPPAMNQTGSFDAEKIDQSPALVELKRLKDHVQKILSSMNVQPGEVSYECLVREGNPGAQIIDEVGESAPDFILMGTHGASGFREFVLGTQTWKVIKKAGVPVFAIPKDALFTGFKRIVLATEYREGELPVISYVTQLAARFKADVAVLHITSSVLSQEFEKKLSNDFLNEVKHRIDYPELQLRVQHATDVIEGIEKFAEEHDTDLLIMSHEKPYFLEQIFSPGASTTKKMSLHSTLPLLVIPDYYNPEFAWFWRLFALDYSIDTDI